MRTPDDYQLYFDITQQGYRDWGLPVMGLVFVAVGVCAVLYARRPGPEPLRRDRSLKLGAWVWLTLSSLWTVATFVVTFREHQTLQHAVQAGEVKYVTGPVEHFVPMPPNGHGDESFEVNGKHFAYSDYTLTAGFNKTSRNGGPIRADREVKVGYVGDAIVYLAWRNITR